MAVVPDGSQVGAMDRDGRGHRHGVAGRHHPRQRTSDQPRPGRSSIPPVQMPGVCRRVGVRIALEFADQLRKRITEDVAAGRTDQEIKSEVVGFYQEEILLQPQATGANLLLWVIPIVLGTLALGGLGLAFVRWRRMGSVHATEEDRELVAAALAPTPDRTASS